MNKRRFKIFEILLSLFPPVNKNAAIKIAEKRLLDELNHSAVDKVYPENLLDNVSQKVYSITNKRPAGIYRTWEYEPCWYAYVPHNDGEDGLILRSSRVLVVSKLTGKIVGEGQAGDEAGDEG